MAYEAATHLGGAAPASLSFRQVGAGPAPLERVLRSHARRHGWIEDPREVLPPHVLVLHDYSPYVPKLSDRTAADLGRSDALVKIVTCALGAEDDAAEKLRAAGLDFAVRYVGKLGSRDIETYAKAASPAGYSALAKRVVAILRTEALPRTPYTVGLLLSVLIRGADVSASPSQTTVLDDYVGAMLGRGDPHEDARLGLDQNSREALLAAFAKHFVMENTGGVSDAEAVRVFEEALERLSWSESAAEVEQSLIERRIIRRVDGKVVFARSSFLHLFAAKRAIQDADFREHLIANPIYYAQILTDYAALNRHDLDLVNRLNALLVADEWTSETGGVFEELERRFKAVDPDRKSLIDSPSSELEPSSESKQVDILDLEDDADDTPFPTTQHEELPTGIRLMRVLELVSSVLRDSDRIEDADVKVAVLRNVLAHWGQLMNTLEQDPEFVAFAREIAEETARLTTASDDDAKEKRILDIARVVPAAIAFGGVNDHLASRRLLTPLNDVVDVAKSDAAIELSIAAVFMLIAVKEPGWVAKVKDLIDGFGNLWVIRNFVGSLLFSSYVASGPKGQESSQLRDLCLDVIIGGYNYKSVQQRAVHRSQLAADLDAMKAKLERQGKKDELDLPQADS